MFNISKRIAMKKIKALANALAAVGIESDTYETVEGDLFLTTHLWNCYDGSSIRFEVYAEADNGYELDHYAEPENDRKKWEADIADLIAEMEAEENS